MANEHQRAQETVAQFIDKGENQAGQRDTLLRALLGAVVFAYQEERTNQDIVRELSFLIDQLQDDVGPITRGS